MASLALDNHPALGLVELLDSLPGITGPDPETVALATLLRSGCLRDLAVLTLTVWPEDDEPLMVDVVFDAWRGRVAALVEQTDALWWFANGAVSGMVAAAAAADGI